MSEVERYRARAPIPYTGPLSGEQARLVREALQQLGGDASGGAQPPQVHIHLPAPAPLPPPGYLKAPIDWTPVIVASIYALVFLVFVFAIAAACEPPAPVIDSNPNCTSWCF